MARADVWYYKNDMTVTLTGLQSSTDTSAYVNSSTGVTAHIWKALTTGSTANRLTTAAVNLSYLAATNGNYRQIFQSTSYTGITSTVRGVAIITVNHSGLNGEWRVALRGENRGTT